MKKQLLNGIITVAIIVATLEIIPFIAGKMFIQNGFSRREIKRELTSQTAPGTEPAEQLATDGGAYLSEHLLHPYLGYVSVPRPGYNNFGFYGPDPLTQKSNDAVNICITGGSVAKQLYQVAADRIRQNLEKHPAFAGKKIQLVSLALGGFKQPQQLLSVNYMMALGAHYDIVINLDGFNEVVLPLSDNLPFHVFPSYPRHWNIYSRKKLDQRVILQMGKQAALKESREQGREKLARSIFKQSNFILFLWKISDQQKNNKILQAEAKLRQSIENNETDYQSTGPAFGVSDTAVFLNDQVKLWVNTSKQLSALMLNGQGRYFHFLQPNQYDAGSKALTADELSIAFEAGPFAYKTAAGLGYPLLRSGGTTLRGLGVNFTDLSGIFKNEKRSVYSDKCCHFNQLGYNTLADAISEAVMADF